MRVLEFFGFLLVELFHKVRRNQPSLLNVVISSAAAGDDEIEHPLQFRWSFWYNRRIQGVRTQESYEKNIKLVGTFGTVRPWTCSDLCDRDNARLSL